MRMASAVLKAPRVAQLDLASETSAAANLQPLWLQLSMKGGAPGEVTVLVLM